MTKRFKAMNKKEHRATMQSNLYISVSKAYLNNHQFTTNRCSCNKQFQADS